MIFLIIGHTMENGGMFICNDDARFILFIILIDLEQLIDWMRRIVRQSNSHLYGCTQI